MSVTIRQATMLSCLLAVCGASSEANASAFALREQSAEGMGNAFAGSAANASDPSTAFFNPAGLARMDSNQAEAQATWIQPQAKFTGTNSSAIPGAPNLTGTLPENAIKPAAIGSVYDVWNAAPDWKLAFAVNTPFGMRSEYKADWVGRYQALATDVTDIDFSVVGSYRINQNLSIGGGPRFSYLKGRLTQALNFKTIGLGAASQLASGATQYGQAAAAAAAAGQASTAAALGAQASAYATQAQGLQTLANSWGDGLGKIEGDDVAAGYTLGALYEFNKETRVGLNYRSRVAHSLAATASFQTPATLALAGPTLSGPFTAQAATLKATLPDSLNVGLHHDLNAQWAVMSSVEWTHWSLIQTLNGIGANGLLLTSLPLKFRDTAMASLGTSYQANDKLALRAGIAYDESPVTDTTRTARLPDSSRYWLSFGGSYTVMPGTDLQLGYTHIIADKALITETTNALLATGTLNGSYDNAIDMVSLGVKVRF
ncbi:MAG TPA: hypothetical protein HPP80_09260 [Rhodospirillaceae bacterium]|nr:hypothetical protein [Rhodospirillaceae bacterium]